MLPTPRVGSIIASITTSAKVGGAAKPAGLNAPPPPPAWAASLVMAVLDDRQVADGVAHGDGAQGCALGACQWGPRRSHMVSARRAGKEAGCRPRMSWHL
jgi:hypothetical protein